MHEQTEIMVTVDQVAGPINFLLTHCPPGGAFGGTRACAGTAEEGVVAAPYVAVLVVAVVVGATEVGTSVEVTAEAVAKTVGAASEGAGIAGAKGTSGVSWIPTLISSSSCAMAPPLWGSLLIVIFLFIKNLDETCPVI